MALTPQQLYQRQQTLNASIQAASGAASLIGSGIGMVNQSKNINTATPTQQLDQFGKPVYNLGDFTQQYNSIKPQGATAGEVGSGVLQGASAGAMFGVPGIIAGAAIGGISQLAFGRRRKNIAKDKKSLAQKSLFNAQRMFNSSMENYNAQQSAQSLYNDQQYAYQNRIGNVYQALS